MTGDSLPLRRPSHPWLRRLRTALAVLAVSLAGLVIGVLLGGHTETDVGPFRAELAIVPSWQGGTVVRLPPLGALELDSHRGPARLSVQLGALDQARTQALINNPDRLATAGQNVTDNLTTGVIRLIAQCLAVALLSSMVLAALVFRRTRRVAWAGGTALAVCLGSLLVAAGTFRADSIREPRYSGLLVNAPAVVGDVSRIADRYDEYAAQLQRLVDNVTRLYTAVSTLPVYDAANGTTRVLHVSDLHLNPSSWSIIQTVVEQFDIDVVVDTGDIVDWGSAPESSYVGAIARLRVPYVFIRGNHDSAATAAAVARQPNAVVLDNTVTEIAGLTFAGIGDPRFTPDKETALRQDAANAAAGLDPVQASGERLAATIRAAGHPVDIALVHDPLAAAPLAGACPLVLAGHVHHRQVSMLPPAENGLTTRLMAEGSTGGAGLRGLEGEKPTPLAMSVLYFDGARSLQAYDDIQIGGTGLSEVTLERHLTNGGVEPPVDPSATPTPTPTGTPPTPTPEPR